MTSEDFARIFKSPIGSLKLCNKERCDLLDGSSLCYCAGRGSLPGGRPHIIVTRGSMTEPSSVFGRGMLLKINLSGCNYQREQIT